MKKNLAIDKIVDKLKRMDDTKYNFKVASGAFSCFMTDCPPHDYEIQTSIFACFMWGMEKSNNEN